MTLPKIDGSILTELHFLPSLYYIARLINFETVELEQCENYNKGSFRNKCMVSSNQQNQYLIVPLKKGKNRSQSIREVKISYEVNWIRTMENGLKTEYSKYPYYDYYIGDIMSIAQMHLEYLFDLNRMLTQYIFEILDIDNYTYTKKYVAQNLSKKYDIRDKITPKYFMQSPHLLRSEKDGYFDYVPGHSFIEALFSYGPEVNLLVRQYSRRIFHTGTSILKK